MTGREPEPDAPDLTPAEEAEVRRRLAEARHTAPVPPEVAARLERTLAGLVEERHTGTAEGRRTGTTAENRRTGPAEAGLARAPEAAASRTGAVVELAARRRRRAGALVLAAAAVVVAGVGLGQLTGGIGSGGGADSGAAGFDREIAESEDGVAAGGAAERLPTSAPATPSGAASEGSAAVDERLLEAVPRIREGSVLEDVAVTARRVRDSVSLARRVEGAACRPAGPGEQAVAVSFRGQLATLVYRVPGETRQRVDLYRCVPPALLRTVSVPAP